MCLYKRSLSTPPNSTTMGTQAEANARFLRLVKGDSGGLHVTASQVRSMLLENTLTAAGPSAGTATIDINALGGKYHNETPLTVAIEASNLAVARVLIEFGAECNPLPIPLRPAVSPLYRAMRQQLNGIEMMRLLLANGASTTAIEHAGMTCLHLVSVLYYIENPQERLQLLFDYIKPNELQRLLSSRGSEGETPLMVAIKNSDTLYQSRGVLAKMLMDAGDSGLELRNIWGWTPMMICIHALRNDPYNDQFQAGPFVLGELLRHGAITDTQVISSMHGDIENIGNTALHEAARWGWAVWWPIHRDKRWALELLLDAGADPNVRNNDGHTPSQLTDVHRVLDVFTTFEAKMEVRRAKCVAFAMGHHARVGEGSSVERLTPDSLKLVIFNVLERM